MNPLLLAAILLPGMPIDLVPSLTLTDDAVILEDQPGEGRCLGLGSLATLILDVDVVEGKHLFDTEKRGLPYTIKMGDPSCEPRLSSWVQGMRVGGARTIFTDFIEERNTLVPASTPLAIHVRLVEAG